MRTLFIAAAFCLLSFAQGFAQVGTSKSDKYRPDWIRKGTAMLNSKKSAGANYEFLEVITTGKSLEEAKDKRLLELGREVKTITQVSGTLDTDVNDRVQGRQVDGYTENKFRFVLDQQSVSFVSRQLDEYWERSSDGRYSLHTLYAVGREDDNPQFDTVTFDRSYAMRSLALSIVPGVGQMCKGQKAKGMVILAGEVACGIGILVCENQRSDNYTKMLEHPSKKKYYDDRTDRWRMGRNICIGAAAALYVYNLIDAATQTGSKRTRVKKATSPSVSFYPTLDARQTGAALAINF